MENSNESGLTEWLRAFYELPRIGEEQGVSMEDQPVFLQRHLQPVTHFLLLALFIFVVTATNLYAEDTTMTSRWLMNARTNGVRFVWANTFLDGEDKLYPNMVPKLEDHIGMMKTHGINMLGVGYPLLRNVELFKGKPIDGRYYKSIQKERVDHLRKIIRTAKKENIAVMVLLTTYKEKYVEIIKDKDYRKVKDMYGSTGEVLACPADRSFWWGIEVPRMELVARLLSEEGAVGGILFETEAYCARKFYPGYGSQKTLFCYCDHCFKTFMERNGIQEKLPKKTERYEWLCRRGLDGKYQQYMVDVFAETYGSIFRYIRNKYPETLGGLYQFGIEPNSEGFVKGVSTDKLPALLFSSAEYFDGYDRTDIKGFSNIARSRDYQTYLSKLNYNTWYLCGLITGPYWPKQYAAELNLILRRTDGYWMYDASIFFKPANKVLTSDPNNRNQYRLKAAPSAFWTEIEKANKAKPQRESGNPVTSVNSAVNADFMLVNSNTIKAHQPQTNSIITTWKCDGIELKPEKGVYTFEQDGPILGKRTRYISAKFKENLEIGATYGFRVHVSNPDHKESRWINLGYSRKPPHPIFYDTNILVRPDTNEEYKSIFSPTEKWGHNYWIRVGVRNGTAPLYVKPFPLERLYKVEFISKPINLPKGQRVSISLKETGSEMFQFRYDLLSVEDDRVLMENCNEDTDVSGLVYLDVEKVAIRVKLLSTTAGLPEKCPPLIWKSFKRK